MKIITDFTELPMLYARHFNRHAMLACILASNGRIFCKAVRLPGSQYDELPFFGAAAFRLNGTPPEDVTPLYETTMIVIHYTVEVWPMTVQYLGSETTYFVIPEPFQYQPEETNMPTDLEQRIAALETRIDEIGAASMRITTEAIPLYRFWDTHTGGQVCTVNEKEVVSLREQWERFYEEPVMGGLIRLEEKK